MSAKSRCFLGCLFSLGCAGRPPGVNSPAAPVLLSVGGTYQTAVTLLTNNCGTVTIQPNPTIVTHTVGATTVMLTHAGNQYSGAVQGNGSFTTTPKVLSAGGETFTITIAGQFSTAGLDAQVTVDDLRPGAATACRYVVRWSGTKDGRPNVIPG